MSSLILPRRFGQQPTGMPTLDMGNSLSNGFFAGWLPVHSMFFGPGVVLQRATMTNPMWVSDPRFGIGQRRNDRFGSGIQQVGLMRGLGQARDVTLVAVARPGTEVSSNALMGSLGQSGNGVSMAVEMGNGTAQFYGGRIYIGGTRRIGGTFPVPPDRPVAVTAIRQRYGVEQSLFVDGVKDPVVGNFTGQMISSGNFGNYNSGSYTEIYALYVWDRALSDDELALLAENPYRMFAEQQARIFIAGESAPPPDSVSIEVPAPGAIARAYVGTVMASASANVAVAGVGAASSVGAPFVSAGSNANAAPGGVGAASQVGTSTVSAGAAPAPTGVTAYGQAGSTASSVDATVAAPGIGASGRVGNVSVSASANPAPEGIASEALASEVDPMAGAEPDPPGVQARFALGRTMQAAPVYPHPSQVAVGVEYGPNGNDYTGTFIGGGGGMSDELADLLRSLAAIHGLIPGSPLVVTQTTRSAGDVSQTITESKGVVTIERA